MMVVSRLAPMGLGAMNGARSKVAVRRLTSIALVTSAAFWFAPTSASALSYSFTCITNNDPGDCAIAEAQVMMDVTDEGGGQVRFTFTNLGSEPSTLAQIYFDDGALSAIATIIDSPPDVDFTQDFSGPMDLPGGGLASPPFVATKEFNTGAASPPPLNGVGIDAGELVALIFDIMPAMTFADVITALNDGSLRAGVHVINFDSGGSESVITPEPAIMVLLGLSIAGLAALRPSRTRRRRPADTPGQPQA